MGLIVNGRSRKTEAYLPDLDGLQHGTPRALARPVVQRSVRALLCVLALGACSASHEPAQGEVTSDASHPGSPSSSETWCLSDVECVAAGPTCCACPTFAVRADDPVVRACEGVPCPGDATCSGHVRAACEEGRCVLACAPMECSLACPSGFAVDVTGCLSCACAPADVAECAEDTECVATRADCCGCQEGGADTAVPAAQLAAFDQALQCPPSPACPSIDICDPAAAPRCIQGRCELVSGELPSDACGRPDLPACPAGTVCSVNASDLANQYGVGMCVPL